MASFIDNTGAQAVVDLTPEIYRAANDANLPLKAYINRTYAGLPSAGTAYDQFKASLGLIVTLIWLYLEMLRLLSKLQSR